MPVWWKWFFSPSPFPSLVHCHVNNHSTPVARDRAALSCLLFYSRLKLLWNCGLKNQTLYDRVSVEVTSIHACSPTPKWVLCYWCSWPDRWCKPLGSNILVQKIDIGPGGKISSAKDWMSNSWYICRVGRLKWVEDSAQYLKEGLIWHF